MAHITSLALGRAAEHQGPLSERVFLEPKEAIRLEDHQVSTDPDIAGMHVCHGQKRRYEDSYGNNDIVSLCTSSPKAADWF